MSSDRSADPANRLRNYLADGAKTQNELYTWWTSENRDPALLRDAIEWLVQQHLAVAKKVGGVKLLELAEAKAVAAPPAANGERPRDWTPGSKPRSPAPRPVPIHEGIISGIKNSPNGHSPSVSRETNESEIAAASPPKSPTTNDGDWMTTMEIAERLGVHRSLIGQCWKTHQWPRRASGKGWEYQRAAIEPFIAARTAHKAPSADDGEWVSTAEACRIVGISVVHLRLNAQKGRIERRATGQGRPTEWSRASLVAFRESRARRKASVSETTPPAAEQPAAIAAAAAPSDDGDAPATPAPRAALHRLIVLVSDQELEFIGQLRAGGLHGVTRELVAERLIADALLRLVERTKLKLKGAG